MLRPLTVSALLFVPLLAGTAVGCVSDDDIEVVAPHRQGADWRRRVAEQGRMMEGFGEMTAEERAESREERRRANARGEVRMKAWRELKREHEVAAALEGAAAAEAADAAAFPPPPPEPR